MEDDGCGEMLERIRADLGLAVSLNAQATIAQAASDLGIDAPGGTLRAQVAVVCQELGVETGWDTTTHGDSGGSSSATDTDVGGLQPEPEPEDGGGEEEDWAAISELPDDEKLRIIFGLFDEDGDGYLNRAEAGTYSRAKQGLDIDDEAWAGVCEALGVEQGIGLALQDFKRMYEMTQGEGNDLRVDYMRLCEGLTITTSIVRTGSVRAAAQDVVLVVRVTGTEASPNGKDELFIVEVTEEDDDYAISLMKYRYKEFQLLRKQLVAHFPEVKNLDFPKAGKSCRLEKLHLWLTNLMDHPDVRCASEFCQFLNIATPTDSDAQVMWGRTPRRAADCWGSRVAALGCAHPTTMPPYTATDSAILPRRRLILTPTTRAKSRAWPRPSHTCILSLYKGCLACRRPWTWRRSSDSKCTEQCGSVRTR
jgi:hypothetical protein